MGQFWLTLADINWYSDNTTVQEAECTSCEVQADKSAYWTPDLFYAHSNGTFEQVLNYGMTVYFLQPTSPSNATSSVVAFPPGFKMLSGDSTQRSFDNSTLTWDGAEPIANRVSFHCIDSSDDLPEQPYMFRTDCVNGMRAQILFQSCWDGVNTYLPGSAHVTYQSQIGNGGCPASHPVMLPLLFFEVLYWTNDIDQSAGGQFTFAQGDTTGYGFHGDFLNGWNQDVLENAVENCLSNTDDADGTVSSCPALAASEDVNFPRDCPEQPSYVPEQITGLLSALPGCNPVTSGPAAVPQQFAAVNSHVCLPNNTAIPASAGGLGNSTLTSSTSTSFQTATVTVNTSTSSQAATGTVSTSTTSALPFFPNTFLPSASFTADAFYPNATNYPFANATATPTLNFTGPPTFNISGTPTTYPTGPMITTVITTTTMTTTISPLTFLQQYPNITASPYTPFPNATASSNPFSNITSLYPMNGTATPTMPANITTFITVTAPVTLSTVFTSLTSLAPMFLDGSIAGTSTVTLMGDVPAISTATLALDVVVAATAV